MKKLGFILMALMLLSGLSINAQTYGKPYRSPYTQKQGVYGNSQVPTITMRSTSTMYGSGSMLPQAAITGTYTADEMSASVCVSRPRRIGGSGFADDDDENPEDKDNTPPEDPGDTVPLGDGVWPLLLLACAYLIVRVTRKRALKS